MEPRAKNSSALMARRNTPAGEINRPPESETKEERDGRLLLLLGEVIRLSQAWVRALESGDPFTAEKWEAECIRAMDRFEANRKNTRSKPASFEQTQ